MKRLIKIILQLGIMFSLTFSESLWNVYFDAEPGEGYDKHLVLDPNVVYTGGIGIFEGTVLIDGNGAVIDLQDGLGIWVTAEEGQEISLDVRYTTIMNGHDYGIYYAGYSEGSIRNCNFINDNMGVKLLDNSNVMIKNCNFINNEQYGVAIVSEIPVCNVSYCNGWNNGEEDYMENCPG